MALTYDPLGAAIHRDNVFYVPEYDRFWYDALGDMARANTEPDTAHASLWWKGAVARWSDYVDSAHPDDPWVSIARVRRQYCERKVRETETRALKRPPQVATGRH
jgi:hypothetical protein